MFSFLLCRPVPSATSARKYTYYAILLIGWGGWWNPNFRLFCGRQARPSEKLHMSSKPSCQTLEPCGIAGREMKFRSACDTIESTIGAEGGGWTMEERVWPIDIVTEILIDEVMLWEEGERIPLQKATILLSWLQLANVVKWGNVAATQQMIYFCHFKIWCQDMNHSEFLDIFPAGDRCSSRASKYVWDINEDQKWQKTLKVWKHLNTVVSRT